MTKITKQSRLVLVDGFVTYVQFVIDFNNLRCTTMRGIIFAFLIKKITFLLGNLILAPNRSMLTEMDYLLHVTLSCKAHVIIKIKSVYLRYAEV